MSSSSLPPPRSGKALPSQVLHLLARDAELARAVSEVDRSLVELAMSHTIVLSDGPLTLRVLDLPTLIDVKSRTGRAKDRVVLPILIATLEEQQKREQT